MSVVAVCEAPGTSGSTTLALALAAFGPSDRPSLILEADRSGGDIGGWADLPGVPSWSTAVAGADRSWLGFRPHLQALPSDLCVMLAPASSMRAKTTIDQSAERFGPMLRQRSDVVAFVDCGRVVERTPWLEHADAVIVLLRQAASHGATISRIDRLIDLCGTLRSLTAPRVLAVIGESPYRPSEIAAIAHCPLLGVLPEDPGGAALAAGAWTIGRGASRTALARSASMMSTDVVDIVDRSRVASPRDRAALEVLQ